MNLRKQLICDALRAFVQQRPGLEFGNYGSIETYRAEMRSITRDLNHARTLLRYVEARDSITADRLLHAAKHAYSGRLSIKACPHGQSHAAECGNCHRKWCDACDPAPSALCHHCHGNGYVPIPGAVTIDYCTGQYWPTEYRRAVCAVLASAIWDYWREHAMPAPSRIDLELHKWNGNQWATTTLGCYSTRDEAEAARADRTDANDCMVVERYAPAGSMRQICAGDWFRHTAKREFGNGIAARWFQ